MQTMRYLIVGGGMTAAAAVAGIREHDADGDIVVVGAEPHPPYKRPLLSKKLWAGGAEDKLWYDPELGGADLKTGRRIVELDLDARRAKDDRGDEYAYEKLLLATGGAPRRLGGNDGEVIYFRTLDDYRALRAKAEGGGHIVIIGGGFIGSELASSLTGIGAKVTLV
jgi:NADPH-dependent 2,4-dienoyl-CoA reductase/sulfur reductase-like enzyme